MTVAHSLEAQYLDGRLLLALPGMPDTRFEDAVIALCLHNDEGAMGIGVGHELDGISLHMLLKDLEIDPGEAPDAAIHFGGPVEPQRGFVIHSPDYTGVGTITPSPLWSVTASREILTSIAQGEGPKEWLIALGYSGWGAGQLEDEMREHGWFAAESHPGILFETPVDDRWHAIWVAEGINPSHLSGQTGHA
jgi:putative transcriptional regulator